MCPFYIMSSGDDKINCVIDFERHTVTYSVWIQIQPVAKTVFMMSSQFAIILCKKVCLKEIYSEL